MYLKVFMERIENYIGSVESITIVDNAYKVNASSGVYLAYLIGEYWFVYNSRGEEHCSIRADY